MSAKSDNFKVDFFGISPPRCATTWMYRNLDVHPEICMSRYKETAYFGKYRYNQGLDFYASCFGHCRPEQLKGDSTPTYFSQEAVAERIKKHNPEAKFYLCLRNPIERSFSHYLHHHSQGLRAASLSFEQAVSKMPEHYLDPSMYYSRLNDFFRFFPRESFLILFYDDLKIQPLKFIQELYEFLGVRDGFIPPEYDKKINPLKKRKIKNKTLFNLVWKTDDFARKNLDFFYGPLRPKAMSAWHRMRKYYLARSGEEAVMEKPVLSEEVGNKLKKIFIPEIEKLEILLDRDLSAWKNNG